MWSIVPLLTTKDFQSNDLIQLMLMYAIGGYISRFGFINSFGSKKWACIWIALSILTITSSIIMMLVGRRFPLVASHTTYFYSRTSFLTIARAIAFFNCFLKLNVRKTKWINTISSTMFGVYLIHDNRLIRRFLWMDLFHNADYQNTLFMIPYSISVILLVFLICIVIELLRKTIINVSSGIYYRIKGSMNH